MNRKTWMLLAACASAAAVFAGVAVQTDENGKAAAVKEAANPDRKAPSGEPPSTPVRGQLLYENHCTSCHESTVYIRERRRAKDLTDLRGWAIHWSNHLNLNWGAEEVDDVVRYLNGKYYRFSSGAK
jgi:mono/diheme cytochrome c family protein